MGRAGLGTLACAGIGIAAWCCVVRCRRVADPVLNLRMFASRPFTGGRWFFRLGFGMTVGDRTRRRSTESRAADWPCCRWSFRC